MNHFLFKMPYQITIDHINYGGHMGHDALFRILQEARIYWLKSLDPNLSEGDIGNNTFWVIRKVTADDLAEGFHGDKIEIVIQVSVVKNASFNLCYDVYNITRHCTLAHAETLMVCLDREDNKVCEIPMSLKKVMMV